MSQAIAAAEQVATESLTVEINIVVTPNFQYDVDTTYVSVPEATTATISWNIIAPDLPPGSGVKFDNPAITFPAESPNEAVTGVAPNRLTMTWVNDEQHRGRSFFYRLHMVAWQPGPDGTTRYMALSHDPTVHNEPPS